MEFFELWQKVNQAKSFVIVDDLVIQDLGGENFLFIEDELILTCRFSMEVYKKALSAMKAFRIDKIWNQNLTILMDLAVLVNGELGTVWNIKKEKIEELDLNQQVHVNMLSVRLHRKASVAWEFRKLLVGKVKPDNELQVLAELQEIHKQNYYLWEYKRWYFHTILSLEAQQAEYQETLKYCSRHISDSSAFHYLAWISRKLALDPKTYAWAVELSQKYYGPQGLFNEKHPPGFETLCLIRAKTRATLATDLNFFQEQSNLNRKTSLIYLNH